MGCTTAVPLERNPQVCSATEQSAGDLMCTEDEQSAGQLVCSEDELVCTEDEQSAKQLLFTQADPCQGAGVYTG